MKQPRLAKSLFGVSALAVVAATAFAFYHVGLSRGEVLTRSALKGTLVTSLNALERYDNGNSEEAQALVRNHMYSAAVVLLSDKEARSDKLVTALVPDLKHYVMRHTPASTLAQAPVEQELVLLLNRIGTNAIK